MFVAVVSFLVFSMTPLLILNLAFCTPFSIPRPPKLYRLWAAPLNCDAVTRVAGFLMQIQAHIIRVLFLPLLAQKLTHTSQWQWQGRGGQDEGSGHATAVVGRDSAVAGPPGRAAARGAGRGEARSGLGSERPPEVLTKREVERNGPRGRLRSLSPPRR